MTKHNGQCSMAFGRYSPEGECPRCDELRAGAPPRKWRESHDARRVREIRAHDCVESKCGPVCTFGDW